MSRNIKEIGKELLGKSLNSFHRKTGLTQLEKNNEMQDGILDGILSQVDDAYIEKTEQSNVIHLDGSGDGVVVLDNIEGNTMVNLSNKKDVYLKGVAKYIDPIQDLKIGQVYTIVFEVKNETTSTNGVLGRLNYEGTEGTEGGYSEGFSGDITTKKGLVKIKWTVRKQVRKVNAIEFWSRESIGIISVDNIILLEGDWIDKDVPCSHFEGLQSSFEDKVNDEGKYKIEILSKNEVIADVEDFKVAGNANITDYGDYVKIGTQVNTAGFKYNSIGDFKVGDTVSLKAKIKVVTNEFGGSCTLRVYNDTKKIWLHAGANGHDTSYSSTIIGQDKMLKLNVTLNENNYTYGDKLQFGVTYGMNNGQNPIEFIIYKDSLTVSLGMDNGDVFKEKKQNKIKLLINEPLRKITSNIKDRLCIKDGKLVVERKCKQVKFDGTIGVSSHRYDENNQIQIIIVYPSPIISDKKNNSAYTINSTLPCITQPGYGMRTVPNFSGYVDSSAKFVGAIPNKTGRSFTDKDAENYFKENPMDVVYELEEPFYEEVLNEYGEPILLEGYENGTIYIDSTIAPTTTVRYTPKMESFKTLNEVSNNNTMLTNDVNDNIIPYMMDVDLMIMEKEMALMSHKNIRKMEALDMTSMQKRTQDMLERLIKGKTLTEQECKTRITTYLNAGKITDAQAKELNFLIDEIYA